MIKTLNKFEIIMSAILFGYVLFSTQDFARVITYYPIEEWMDNLTIPPIAGLIFLVLFYIAYIIGLAKIESKKSNK